MSSIKTGELVLTKTGEIAEVEWYEPNQLVIGITGNREIALAQLTELAGWLIERKVCNVAVTIQHGWVTDLASRPSLIGMDNTIAKLVQAKQEYPSV